MVIVREVLIKHSPFGRLPVPRKSFLKGTTSYRTRSLQEEHTPSKQDLLTTLDKALSLIEDEEEKKNETTRSINAKRSLGIRQVIQLTDGEIPRVAIVGRPNVGKSALLNRLTKSSRAIVFDKPGVTRDRLLVRANWQRSEFMLMDTGGLPDTRVVTGCEDLTLPMSTEAEIPVEVEKQVAVAVEESDAIIFVVDGKEGPVEGDKAILDWLRKQHSDKAVVMAVNKCENSSSADFNASLFWELGIQPFPVSAMTGLGTGELLDELVTRMPAMRRKRDEEEITSVAIIGRPNTGKSSLLNSLVGENRAIVSKVAGTTRDAVDCQARLSGGQLIKLVDTAGIRRRIAVYGSAEKVEPLMVNRSLKAIKQCNIAVLVIDCYEGVRIQDAQIVDAVKEEGCGLVVVANKFDLLDRNDWDKNTVKAVIKQQLRSADWAVIVVTSIKEETPLKAVSKAILTADKNHSKRVTTSTVNMIIQDAFHFRQPAASKKGKRGRVYYSSQVSVRPPTFVLFVNDPSLFDESYRKYIEKQLRENVDFVGTPVKVLFKGKPRREFK